MKYFILSIVLLLFIDLKVSQAQMMSVELDSVTVTASRISSTISESGKSVSVISRQEIDAMPATSVDELIRDLPGVNINSRQGFGIQSDVGIRGTTFSQVLFLLDNVPLNDPLTAHFSANIPVSLSEIGQIEIVRGPASASYGADAVGGVVHIKTKMYMEREADLADNNLTFANANIAGGQNELLMGDFAVEGQHNRLRASASLRTVSSSGERLSNPGYHAGVSQEQYYDNYFEHLNFNTALSYRISDNWSWYARGGMDERDFSARYFYTRSEVDESVEQISNRWMLSALTRNSGAHRTELNASYRQVEDTFDFNSRLGIPANEHTTGLLFLNLSHQISLGDSQRLNLDASRIMFGGQLTNKTIESTDRGNHDDLMGGMYVIGHTTLNNGLNLTASGRLQFDAHGNSEIVPQLSTSYSVGDITLRSSFGRAIRVGDFTERFISSQIPDLTPGRNIGNPDLAPEHSYTIDAGLDWRPSTATMVSPTFFYRTSDNLIDYVLTNSADINNADNLLEDENYFYASNIASSQTMGVEVLTSYRMQFDNRTFLRLEGGYTWIQTTSSSGEVSKYIANHPLHQATLGLRFTMGSIRVNSQSSYRVRTAEVAEILGAEVPEGYFITNLNLDYAPEWSQGIVFYTRIMNLTDTQYQEILGSPMPGRWVMGGLRYAI